MPDNLKDILKTHNVEASSPCRIDMGGTLDINTFYYPLSYLSPCTFNIAIDLRTTVRLLPHRKGMIKVSSRGFESAEYPLDEAPFDHPLGLMFVIASYFRAEGVHIVVDSASPPRSALGGSSAAAIALIGAFSKVFEQIDASIFSRKQIAILAHALEESVAGVPCGLQDQLAAAYGGVNAWYWRTDMEAPLFRKKTVIKKASLKNLERHLLVAYGGRPHASKNINGRWIRQFLSGKHRKLWVEVVRYTQKFVDAMIDRSIMEAAAIMNKETAIRRKMTPDVLDDIGAKLVDSAIKNNCGARFTGAGGGGCVWGLGELEDIGRLKEVWGKILSSNKKASMLDFKIDSKGLLCSL